MHVCVPEQGVVEHAREEFASSVEHRFAAVDSDHVPHLHYDCMRGHITMGVQVFHSVRWGALNAMVTNCREGNEVGRKRRKE